MARHKSTKWLVQVVDDVARCQPARRRRQRDGSRSGERLDQRRHPLREVPENVRGQVALAALVRDGVRDFQDILHSCASQGVHVASDCMWLAFAIFWTHFTSAPARFQEPSLPSPARAHAPRQPRHAFVSKSASALRSGLRQPLGDIADDFRGHVTRLLILRRGALPLATDEQVIQSGI